MVHLLTHSIYIYIYIILYYIILYYIILYYIILGYATCTSDLAQPLIRPDTQQNIFPKYVVRTCSRCLKRTPGSHLQAAQVPFTPAHQMFCRRPAKSPLPDSLFALLHLVFTDHRLTARLGFSFGFHFGLIAMAYTGSDVPNSVPSSPAPPSTAGSSTSSTHRSCQSYTGRMSSLPYIMHTFCVACRDVQCSVNVRCDECTYWS